MANPTFTHATGVPVADNTNIKTAGRRGLALLEDIWLIEELAHFDREVIPERGMHAKGWGANGRFTVTHDITRYTKAQVLEIGKKSPCSFGCRRWPGNVARPMQSATSATQP